MYLLQYPDTSPHSLGPAGMLQVPGGGGLSMVAFWQSFRVFRLLVCFIYLQILPDAFNTICLQWKNNIPCPRRLLIYPAACLQLSACEMTCFWYRKLAQVPTKLCLMYTWPGNDRTYDSLQFMVHYKRLWQFVFSINIVTEKHKYSLDICHGQINSP